MKTKIPCDEVTGDLDIKQGRIARHISRLNSLQSPSKEKCSSEQLVNNETSGSLGESAAVHSVMRVHEPDPLPQRTAADGHDAAGHQFCVRQLLTFLIREEPWVLVYDTELGPQMDVLDESVRMKVKQLLLLGAIATFGAARVCSSFSVAITRPIQFGVLDILEAYQPGLRASMRLRVQQGNQRNDFLYERRFSIGSRTLTRLGGGDSSVGGGFAAPCLRRFFGAAFAGWELDGKSLQG